MLADLILNAFGEVAAKRYRSLRRILWLGLLACIVLVIYASMP
jgi:hypothetical protein